MTHAPKLAVIALVLLAAGCGGSGKPTATASTTASTAAPAVTTTTDTTLAIPVSGTDDPGVEAHMHNAITTEFVLFTGPGRFTADVATLESTDPGDKYGAGLALPTNPAVVNVAVSADGKWACLTGRSNTGGEFIVALDSSRDVYQSSRPFTACNDNVSRGLTKISG